VSWERALVELFDDLETRAEGLAHELRDDDVADLSRAEYAEVSLQERLHGAVGGEVTVDAAGGVRVRGRLDRVGKGCAVVTGGAGTGRPAVHLVNLDHEVTVSTSSQRAAAEPLQGVTARLGLASAVRHLAEDVDAVAVTTTDGRRRTGRIGRVGADFLEISPDVAERDDLDAAVGQETALVPLRAVVVLVAG
jgi:hypothetical protein